MLTFDIVADLAAAVNIEAEEADVGAAAEVAADVGASVDFTDQLDIDLSADVATDVGIDDLGIG